MGRATCGAMASSVSAAAWSYLSSGSTAVSVNGGPFFPLIPPKGSWAAPSFPVVGEGPKASPGRFQGGNTWGTHLPSAASLNPSESRQGRTGTLKRAETVHVRPATESLPGPSLCHQAAPSGGGEPGYCGQTRISTAQVSFNSS